MAITMAGAACLAFYMACSLITGLVVSSYFIRAILVIVNICIFIDFFSPGGVFPRTYCTDGMDPKLLHEYGISHSFHSCMWQRDCQIAHVPGSKKYYFECASPTRNVDTMYLVACGVATASFTGLF